MPINCSVELSDGRLDATPALVIFEQAGSPRSEVEIFCGTRAKDPRFPGRSSHCDKNRRPYVISEIFSCVVEVGCADESSYLARRTRGRVSISLLFPCNFIRGSACGCPREKGRNHALPQPSGSQTLLGRGETSLTFTYSKMMRLPTLYAKGSS